MDFYTYRCNTPNPCKHCKDRFVGCHGKCDRYLAWRKDYTELTDKIRKEKEKRDGVNYPKVPRYSEMHKKNKQPWYRDYS